MSGNFGGAQIKKKRTVSVNASMICTLVSAGVRDLIQTIQFTSGNVVRQNFFSWSHYVS